MNSVHASSINRDTTCLSGFLLHGSCSHYLQFSFCVQLKSESLRNYSLLIKPWCCSFYCCHLSVLSLTLNEQTGSAIWMASHLVTSGLEWPLIFELWPECHINGDTISLPFIPSHNQRRLIFAPEAFCRNVLQKSLSFGLLKYQDRQLLAKKVFMREMHHIIRAYVNKYLKVIRKKVVCFTIFLTQCHIKHITQC